jgi:hypothetical protein
MGAFSLIEVQAVSRADAAKMVDSLMDVVVFFMFDFGIF